jgi:hypothetical protein
VEKTGGKKSRATVPLSCLADDFLLNLTGHHPLTSTKLVSAFAFTKISFN